MAVLPHPFQLLESLLSLNLDPVSLSSVASPRPLSSLTSKLLLGGTGKEREKGPTPPPIDPGVFRSVINIRRLVDEGAKLRSLFSERAIGLMLPVYSLRSGDTSVQRSLSFQPRQPQPARRSA